MGRHPESAQHFSTDKTWDTLGFLFRRLDFPVDVAQGEEPFADQEDWGYGPPRFPSLERVRLAAREPSRLSYDDLIDGVNHTGLSASDVYLQGRDAPASLE